MYPLVVVLDLDGTIIGDISPQIVSYEIHKEIKQARGKSNYNTKDLCTKLNNGIIRPFFTEFISKTKASIPHVEFFIYTASEKKWATYIIGQIEKACKIKINRPIFTRSQCFPINNEYKKSLKLIKPAIFRTLRRRYQMADLKDLNDRILVVDNMDVYQGTDAKYHVKCTTYDFVYPENIPSMIDHETFHKHSHILSRYTTRYMMFECKPDYHEFQHKFYSYFVTLLSKTSQNNSQFTRDTFFKLLYKILIFIVIKKQYNKFDDKVVKYINKQLHTHR